MNFDFSEDLKLFADGLAKGLAAACTLADVRQCVVDGRFHAPSWQFLVDMGVPALALPESDGGAHLGMLPLALAAQAIGHALVPVPSFSSLYAFTNALMLAARSANAAASEAFRFAARECLQLHGGIGFTFEGNPQLFYRRSRLYSSLLDSPFDARAQIAARLMVGERPLN